MNDSINVTIARRYLEEGEPLPVDVAFALAEEGIIIEEFIKEHSL